MNIKKHIKPLAVVIALLALVVTAFAIGRTTAPPASVTLAWDASPSPAVNKYTVYYGPASGTYTNAVSTAGPNLTLIVSNLVRGATYYFAATASDTNSLESDYSNEVSTSTKAPPLPPPNARITGSN